MRALKNLVSFMRLSIDEKALVFYAEDAPSYDYFAAAIDHIKLASTCRICYVSSSQSDPILDGTDPRIIPFYIGSGLVRTLFFLLLKARVLVMTMPDLDSFHIKRSLVHPVHYAYIFHSLVSTHMIYRSGAFDHFDSLLCAGPHHLAEIRRREELLGMKPKVLVECGYGKLDGIIRQMRSLPARAEPNTVLIAPSWGEGCIIETVGESLVEALLAAGFKVLLRPHPRTLRARPEVIASICQRFATHSLFHFCPDISSVAAYAQAQIMISDWSGAAFEYSFALLRPVLFVDVPRKINNAAYADLGMDPMEVALRSRIGVVLHLDDLSSLVPAVRDLIERADAYPASIAAVRDAYVFHVSKSGQEASAYLRRIAQVSE